MAHLMCCEPTLLAASPLLLHDACYWLFFHVYCMSHTCLRKLHLLRGACYIEQPRLRAIFEEKPLLLNVACYSGRAISQQVPIGGSCMVGHGYQAHRARKQPMVMRLTEHAGSPLSSGSRSSQAAHGNQTH
eukprot:954944-Pelagomonas_calceolata.AAC.4